MPIFATAGSKLYIGGALSEKAADFVLADFDSQTWVEIDPLESIGSMGDTAQEITFEAIGRNRTQTLKGTRRAPTMEVVAGLDMTDAGQIALVAAEAQPYDYAFKVVFDDAPATGSAPTPSERYFIAKVMSATEELDSANNVMKLNSSLAINSNLVRVNAATGD
ncbi:hypothetical protein [Ahrensia marina]|uniref:Phage tail protein n=1 Tax=Ahrensia marina TaxID=1514904 RepID=A0A0M9GKM1_9HYPH|nr:hypothetical protein [Ahrensia marina]KPA99969.1 hypothetical protein SU32_16330 [Ahrensia marina]